VNRRSGTAPEHRREEPARLAGWLTLVTVMIALGYLSRATAGKPDPDVLYHWSTAVYGVVQDAIVLAIVLWIAWGRFELLALRRPLSAKVALRVLGTAIVGIYIFEVVYSGIVHPGNEQGLTPSHWEPSHAAAYVINGVVICTFIPFVEELTFRGVGYSLLERFGRWQAIIAVGVIFGLAHGLIESLPVIAVLGSLLAWIRARTDSVVPGMVLHSAFNLVALVAAVTLNG
jgi:membrane protease YdiL (CAAX protease family)